MPKEKEESKLEKLKKEYKKVQDKHKLPSFEKLNEDFHIEKAAEVESDFLIREVRKLVSEKPYNYLRFVETLINPVNAPMSILSVIKTLGQEEKDKLTEIYKKLVKNEVHLIEAEINFSEEREAEFIRSTWKMWQEIKKEFADVFKKVNESWENKSNGNNNKYLG